MTEQYDKDKISCLFTKDDWEVWEKITATKKPDKVCIICGKIFRFRYDLLNHYRQVHHYNADDARALAYNKKRRISGNDKDIASDEEIHIAEDDKGELT